jgi:predicted RNA-binding protein with PUA domain
MPRERRVLARLVGRYVGTTRGVFEFADGGHVEIDGVLDFDSAEAPEPGEKAVVVVDENGRVLRWEPYGGARHRRGLN